MEDEMNTPSLKVNFAEVLGYMCCAKNVPMDACLAAEGTGELQTAFWNGWNARYEEETTRLRDELCSSRIDDSTL
jgi:hypothetical protein